MSLKLSAKLSFEEKKQAVRNFIVACYHNQMKIKTYHRLAMFLNEDRIKLLRTLSKSGERPITKGNVYYGTEKIYTDGDAENYFVLLIAIINETEEAKKDVIRLAYNQLFRFLYVMRDDMQRDKNVQLIVPFDWMNLFAGWDKVLVEMKNEMEYRDKEILDILKSLLLVLEQNRKSLETMQKDYERIVSKGLGGASY